jgi:hypothetical protein
MQSGVHTPVARQPAFPCSGCIRRFYNAAGLKNHFRAKHGSQATDDRASQMSSPVLDHLSSPQNSDNEEEPSHSHHSSSEIHNQESTGSLSPPCPPDGVSMDVDSEHQPPFPDDHDQHDYGYNDNMDCDLSSSDSHSSPPIIPSSPGAQHVLRSHGHQQTAVGDTFLRRVYHDKLNGKFIMYFSHFNKLHSTSRSEM